MKREAFFFIFAILISGNVLFGKGVQVKSGDNSVLIKTSFFMSPGMTMLIPGSFGIVDSLVFQNSGSLYFSNTSDSYVKLSSGSLGLGEIIFNGNANYNLSVDKGRAHISNLKVDLQNAKIDLDGNLSIVDKLNLKSGIINVLGNSHFLIENTAPDAVDFNGSSMNGSYVVGFMSRKIEAGKSYQYPIGDLSGFHPFLIDNPDKDDIIQVEFDRNVPYECNNQSTTPQLLIENSIGWRVQSCLSQKNNFFPGLSILNSSLDEKIAQLEIYHVSENEVGGTIISPVKGNQGNVCDNSYLKGAEKKSYGLLTFVQIFGSDLVNFLYVGGNNQTNFEIPDQGDFSDIRFYVYNQLGQMVFKGDHYRNQFDARNYPDGTYFYELTLVKENKRSVIRDFIEIKHEK